MNVLMYMNFLTGEYNVSKKINQWFSNFLDSFRESEYNVQTTRIEPWQYKNLMTTAERNHWHMLTEKQWSVFEKNINFESGTYEMFANFKHKGRTFEIRVARATGFATIKISG